MLTGHRGCCFLQGCREAPGSGDVEQRPGEVRGGVVWTPGQSIPGKKIAGTDVLLRKGVRHI